MFEERHQNNFEYKPATCGICAYFIAYFLFCNCQDSHKVPRKFKNVATFCEGNSNPASINCILKVMNKLLLCLSCGTKVFSFNLNVESEYPVRGGTSSRSSDAQISVSVEGEPNEDPVASDALSLIVGDDGLSVATLLDDDDGNDYDADAQLWYVPHDGDP